MYTELQVWIVLSYAFFCCHRLQPCCATAYSSGNPSCLCCLGDVLGLVLSGVAAAPIGLCMLPLLVAQDGLLTMPAAANEAVEAGDDRQAPVGC